MENESGDERDLLEKIKNFSLKYNQKVTPRRQIQIQKPVNAFDLFSNGIASKILSYISF